MSNLVQNLLTNQMVNLLESMPTPDSLVSIIINTPIINKLTTNIKHRSIALSDYGETLMAKLWRDLLKLDKNSHEYIHMLAIEYIALYLATDAEYANFCDVYLQERGFKFYIIVILAIRNNDILSMNFHHDRILNLIADEEKEKFNQQFNIMHEALAIGDRCLLEVYNKIPDFEDINLYLDHLTQCINNDEGLKMQGQNEVILVMIQQHKYAIEKVKQTMNEIDNFNVETLEEYIENYTDRKLRLFVHESAIFNKLYYTNTHNIICNVRKVMTLSAKDPTEMFQKYWNDADLPVWAHLIINLVSDGNDRFKSMAMSYL